MPLALSPELNQRLMQEFPRGSSQDRLTSALVQQGFTLEPRPCTEDRSVRMAWFSQHGGGFAGPYPMHANIFWKVDRSNRLVWTKGFVEYTGP